MFGPASYDALNRLTSADFSSWSGSGWTSTLAHDLTGITYDASGNLTALSRRRETGTVLDQLTYGSASTSNRLLSVTEAAGISAEAWDAEGGTFTYDANGNLLTAPAPYALSAVTYDPRNLPLTVTRAGVTSAYRYDASGQRITKQVGGGATEVYVLDGATALGVVTLDAAGSPTAWAFSVLAGERVIGRAPHTGARRHYHTDLLGSTRAVVEGATILESTDYDPWGLALPGRTLGAGSGTKEGFTGKERDAESGLDYFGARQYLSAFGRWGSVDPLAAAFPAWSPYNYVLNDPNGLIDPDGRNPCIVGPVAARICSALFTATGSAIGAMAAQAWLNAEAGRPVMQGVAMAGLEGARDGAAVALLPASAAVTGGRAAGRAASAGTRGRGTAGSIRGVNPLHSATNCVNCAIATDAILAGRAASALPSGPTSISVLETMFGGQFARAGGQRAIEAQLLKAGNGARGIVFGSRGAGETGHVFNAVNQNGVVRFLDGQAGRAASFSGYTDLFFLRTF